MSTLLVMVGERTCRICNTPKPVTEFPKNSKCQGGRAWLCKPCNADKAAEWYLRNPERKSAWRYSVPVDWYHNTFKAQNGLCAACGRPETDGKRLKIDHDHSCCPGYRSCGKCVRALLCNGCNTSMGQAKDDPEVLEKQAAYLRKWGK